MSAPEPPLSSAPGGLSGDSPRTRERWSWVLFDFANQSFPMVIITAVYVLYFKNTVVGGEDPGQSDFLWGLALSSSALLAAISAPFMGALADARRWRKLLLGIYTVVCILSTLMLGFSTEGMIVFAMIFVILGNATYEGGMIFYSSLLPGIAKPGKMGRLSGLGWAFGYIGGLASLGVSLVFALAGEIRIVIFITAIWYALFSLPLFFFVRDRAPVVHAGAGVRDVARSLGKGFRSIRQYRGLLLFFAAYFLYNDAIVTTFAFAAPFAQDELAFGQTAILGLIMAVQITGAIGAFSLGYVADRLGNLQTIALTLIVLAGVTLLAFSTALDLSLWQDRPSLRAQLFVLVGLLFGIAMGATQATSRAFLASVIPPDRSGEFFGYYGLVGRFSAVLGPVLFGGLSWLTGSKALSVLSLTLMFLAGLFLLRRVDEDRLRAEMREGGEGAQDAA